MRRAVQWWQRYNLPIQATILLIGLYLISLYSYLLFHSVAEGFSILVGFSTFLFAWNSRRFLKTDYFLFLGIAYMASASLDFLHTLAYQGMQIFDGYGTDLSAQLWLGARFVQSIALLISPTFLRRRINPGPTMAGFSLIVALWTALSFARALPPAYVEGEGLTAFKMGSEFLIILILAGALVTHARQRHAFEPGIFALLIGSIALTIASELPFSLYVNIYGSLSLIGHFLKIIAFFLIYKAVLQTGLVNPFDLLFHDLEQAQERYRAHFRHTPNALALFQVERDGGTPNYVFIEGNQALARLAGIDPKTSVGKRLSDVPLPLDRAALRAVFEKARSQGGPVNVEQRAIGQDRYFWVSVFSASKGQMAMLLEDISQRKRTETLEREQRELAEALRDTANALNSALDFSQVLDRVLNNLGRVIPHDIAKILLIDPETGAARVVGSRTADPAYGDRLAGLSLPVATTPHLLHMARTGQPLIVDDIQTETGMHLAYEAYWRAYLGAPIRLENQVIGFIGLGSWQPDFFDETHAARLEAFAGQVAIAIHNARMLERERALIAAQERERLARDLHDAVSQTLFSASMIAESLPRQWQRNPEKAHAQLAELHELTRGAMAEMRVLLLELRPTSLLDVDLPALLRQLVEAIRSRKRMAISVEVEGEFSLDPEIKLALYRITQEALNNIAKHSRATEASIRLVRTLQGVDLTIKDNGAGFDLDGVPPTSLGLDIMRERSDEIGAALTITSQPGQGTRLHLLLAPEKQPKTAKGPGM